MKRRFWQGLALHLFLTPLALLWLAPLWLMLVFSTHPETAIFSTPTPLLPGDRFWANLQNLQADTNFLRALFNSVAVSSLYTLLSLVLTSLAGYAFARFQFFGKGLLFSLVIATLTIPYFAVVIPQFILVAREAKTLLALFIGMGVFGGVAVLLAWLRFSPGLSRWLWLGYLTAALAYLFWGVPALREALSFDFRLTNTYWAVILPALANSLGVFFMRQNFLSLPQSLLEAARIDGASELRIFFRIALPLVLPAMAALAIILFLSAWNDYLWPLLVLSDKNMQTAPVALGSLIGLTRVSWGGIMVGAVLTTLPFLILFLFLQRYFIAGITAGGVKD
ncbi:carbohydrate ABC transporter permease [Meiothermus sp. QL-1]|uniref:carbohydrate ABC transporter permease n=1 Tax=Meiothermus sp. QL-1 TaxID=2058095 RepID=UPI000E0B3322|nr:carbohydrate ABC transporter permease [Meiothermus sp. QL-1]RDI95299.1 carbohydrate ABC transporter permease [Meiothermus sp. QL-1]